MLLPRYLTMGLFVSNSFIAENEVYYWSLYPKSETDQCIYGYDSTKNKSLISDPLPSSVLPKTKNGETGLFVSRKKEAVLGNFFAECVLDPSVCKSFTTSFLVYIEGSLTMDDFVHVINTVSKAKGHYYIGFTVTRNIARLEAEAYVVVGKSSNILKKSGVFPGTGIWVHVGMVFTAASGTLELYLNGQKTIDPQLVIPWNGTDTEVKIAFGNRKTSNDFLISVFQILKGGRAEDKIQQLRNHSHSQGITCKIFSVIFYVILTRVLRTTMHSRESHVSLPASVIKETVSCKI